MEKQKIIDFLLLNGFEQTEPDAYANDYCGVVIEEDRIAVTNNLGQAEYSPKTEVYYWLIGCLIARNYVQFNQLITV